MTTMGTVRRYAAEFGMAAALAGGLVGAAKAEDPAGAQVSPRRHVENPGWSWSGYRPSVYYSAPPVLWPALGFREQPLPARNDFSFPLSDR